MLVVCSHSSCWRLSPLFAAAFVVALCFGVAICLVPRVSLNCKRMSRFLGRGHGIVLYLELSAAYQLLSASMKDQSWYTVRLFRVGSSHVPKSPAAVRNPIPHSVCRATINGDYIAASTLDCPLWFVRTWHRY